MAALLVLPLAGCGFRPLYGERVAGDGTAQDRLGEVNVMNIPERSGQLLREALKARMERNGDAAARRYDLSVQFGVTGEAVGIQQDTSASRLRMVGTASWWLYATDAQRRTLASGTAREVDGYNLFNLQYFASDLENAAVQRRMADAIAEQITLQVANYFHFQPDH